jgi:PAS domain S-box-containing protein
MSTDEHYLKTELYRLIREDESIFEFLQRGSLDGIWYWDLETQTDEWLSSRFWTTFGYDPAERKHLASEWQDLIDPHDLQVALDNFTKHCADSNHPYDQVVRYRHADGSTVWVRCRGIVIRDEEGNPIRMLGAHTDVTAQKRAEEALQKRTKELQEANQQLQEALESIKTLKGLIPICSYCKNIRDDTGYWNHLETYLQEHSQAEFSHGICPKCTEEHFGNTLREASGTETPGSSG